jgi:cardiolipin synthase
VVEEPIRDVASRQDPAEDDRSNEIYTIANIITVLRLILVPFFFAVLINGQHDVLAFLLFFVAASTDWLDGQIARRTGTVTALGKAIDPLVDRLLLASGVLGLYMVHRLPLWTVVVLFARDAYLMYGAWRLEQFHKTRLPVTYAGKTTTAVLLFGFSDLILGWPVLHGAGVIESALLPGLGHAPAVLGIWFIYAGIALSLGTAIHYTVLFLRITREGNAR